MFSNLILGRQEGPYRSEIFGAMIVMNWIGLLAALSQGWQAGVAVMLTGMVFGGAIGRFLAARAASVPVVDADTVERVHARLEALAAVERELLEVA